MPLHLTKEESETLKEGLELFVGSKRANHVKEILAKNPDCVHWYILTEEEKELLEMKEH